MSLQNKSTVSSSALDDKIAHALSTARAATNVVAKGNQQTTIPISTSAPSSIHVDQVSKRSNYIQDDVYQSIRDSNSSVQSSYFQEEIEKKKVAMNTGIGFYHRHRSMSHGESETSKYTSLNTTDQGIANSKVEIPNTRHKHSNSELLATDTFDNQSKPQSNQHNKHSNHTNVHTMTMESDTSTNAASRVSFGKGTTLTPFSSHAGDSTASAFDSQAYLNDECSSTTSSSSSAVSPEKVLQPNDHTPVFKMDAWLSSCSDTKTSIQDSVTRDNKESNCQSTSFDNNNSAHTKSQLHTISPTRTNCNGTISSHTTTDTNVVMSTVHDKASNKPNNNDIMSSHATTDTSAVMTTTLHDKASNKPNSNDIMSSHATADSSAVMTTTSHDKVSKTTYNDYIMSSHTTTDTSAGMTPVHESTPNMVAESSSMVIGIENTPQNSTCEPRSANGNPAVSTSQSSTSLLNMQKDRETVFQFSASHASELVTQTYTANTDQLQSESEDENSGYEEHCDTSSTSILSSLHTPSKAVHDTRSLPSTNLEFVGNNSSPVRVATTTTTSAQGLVSPDIHAPSRVVSSDTSGFCETMSPEEIAVPPVDRSTSPEDVLAETISIPGNAAGTSIGNVSTAVSIMSTGNVSSATPMSTGHSVTATSISTENVAFGEKLALAKDPSTLHSVHGKPPHPQCTQTSDHSAQVMTETHSDDARVTPAINATTNIQTNTARVYTDRDNTDAVTVETDGVLQSQFSIGNEAFVTNKRMSTSSCNASTQISSLNFSSNMFSLLGSSYDFITSNKPNLLNDQEGYARALDMGERFADEHASGSIHSNTEGDDIMDKEQELKTVEEQYFELRRHNQQLKQILQNRITKMTKSIQTSHRSTLHTFNSLFNHVDCIFQSQVHSFPADSVVSSDVSDHLSIQLEYRSEDEFQSLQANEIVGFMQLASENAFTRNLIIPRECFCVFAKPTTVVSILLLSFMSNGAIPAMLPYCQSYQRGPSLYVLDIARLLSDAQPTCILVDGDGVSTITAALNLLLYNCAIAIQNQSENESVCMLALTRQIQWLSRVVLIMIGPNMSSGIKRAFRYAFVDGPNYIERYSSLRMTNKKDDTSLDTSSTEGFHLTWPYNSTEFKSFVESTPSAIRRSTTRYITAIELFHRPKSFHSTRSVFNRQRSQNQSFMDKFAREQASALTCEMTVQESTDSLSLSTQDNLEYGSVMFEWQSILSESILGAMEEVQEGILAMNHSLQYNSFDTNPMPQSIPDITCILQNLDERMERQEDGTICSAQIYQPGKFRSQQIQRSRHMFRATNSPNISCMAQVFPSWSTSEGFVEGLVIPFLMNRPIMICQSIQGPIRSMNRSLNMEVSHSIDSYQTESNGLYDGSIPNQSQTLRRPFASPDATKTREAFLNYTTRQISYQNPSTNNSGTPLSAHSTRRVISADELALLEGLT